MSELMKPVSCPKCGTTFQKPLHETAAGAVVECPSCQEPITITADEAAPTSQMMGDLLRRITGY
jgi:hypothetical protein